MNHLAQRLSPAEGTLPNQVIDWALGTASRFHQDGVDKDGKAYSLHWLRVGSRGENDAEVVTGVLHDTVEDTPLTLDDVEREVTAISDKETSLFVRSALDSVTHRSGKNRVGKTDEPYKEYVFRAGRHPVGRFVKMADLRDNSKLDRLLFDERTLERLAKYKKALNYLRTGEWPA
jgi:hypothetical protein